MNKALLFAALLLATAPGQTQVERMLLPDSLAVLGIGSAHWFDSASGKFYIAGNYAISVIAGPEGRRVGRIDLPGSGEHQWFGLFGLPSRHRLYAVASYDTLVWVIDTRYDSIVDKMVLPRDRVFEGSIDACLNTRRNKLYVMTYYSGCAKFDLTADTFERFIPLPITFSQPEMVYNPTADKYYIQANYNQVAIFDAAADTFLALVQAGNGLTGLACLSATNKVYAGAMFDSVVTIIDGAGDSVVHQLRTPPSAISFVVNEEDKRVYAACAAAWAVIDGVTDSLRCAIPVIPGYATHGAHCLDNRRVFLGGPTQLIVVDGPTDSVLERRPYELYRTWAFWNRPAGLIQFHRINCTAPWQVPKVRGSELIAIDQNTHDIVWSEVTGFRAFPYGPAWSRRRREMYLYSVMQRNILAVRPPNHVRELVMRPGTMALVQPLTLDDEASRLYLPLESDSSILVMTTDPLQLLDTIALPAPTPKPLVVAPGLNRAWCEVTTDSIQQLVCIDLRTRRVTRVLTMSVLGGGGPAGVVSMASGKLYWPNGNWLVVVDVATDSILRRIRVTSYDGQVMTMHWREDANLLYVATTDPAGRVRVVNCATDSLERIIYGLPPTASLSYVPAVNKLYALAANSGHLYIVDCNDYHVCGHIAVNGVDYQPLLYNPVDERIYFMVYSPPRITMYGNWWLAGVDCRTDTIVTATDVGGQPEAFLLDPDSGKVFVYCNNSVLYTFRSQTPSMAAPPTTGRRQAGVWVSPNPTPGGVAITARVPEPALTRIVLYDAAGRQVRVLAEATVGPGLLQTVWDGTDGRDRQPVGVYHAVLEAGSSSESCKLILTH